MNNGATITIAPGAFLSCEGGIVNSGIVNNNGILGLTGSLTNTGSVDGGGIIHIGGDWVNIGTFSHGSGTVVFDGTEPQVIAAPYLTVFNNLVVDGLSAGTTIAAGTCVTVEGDVFSPNGKLVINSDALNNNGSLIYLGAATPQGTVTFNRQLRTGSVYGDKHLFSAPAGGTDIAGFISASNTGLARIDSIRIWNETGGRWEKLTSGQFQGGKGYNVSQSDLSDGFFSFTGSVVSSVTVAGTSPYEEGYNTRITNYPLNPYGNSDPGQIVWATGRGWISGWGGGGWNLLGNPFTSAMDAKAFITANENDFDPYYRALYLYDGPAGYYRYVAVSIPGYDSLNTAGGPFGTVVQAGQGFMVMANNNNVQFGFSSAMQVHQPDITMLKSASTVEPWPGLRLKVAFGERESMTTVVFNNDMEASLDPGYDVGLLTSDMSVEVYTLLASGDEGVSLSRQALPLPGDGNSVIPVGIDTEKGGEVTFSAIVVPAEDKKFWLEDRVAGVFTDLGLKSYTVILPSNTYGTGRFFLLASANTPTGIHSPGTDDNSGLRIWSYDGKVIIKGEVGDKALCEIYDLPGHKILETRLTDRELNTVNMPSGTKGIFIVRVIDGSVITVRKVVIP